MSGAAATVVEDRTNVMPTPGERAQGILLRWQQVVWLAVGVLDGLIAIRFVLVALGANMQAGFGTLLYTITQPFDLPFRVLFGDQNKALGKGAAVEMGSLIAMVVYVLLAWAIARVISLTMAPRTVAA